MSVYIGAENIVSPLGKTIEANFNALLRDETGIRILANPFAMLPHLAASVFADSFLNEETKITQLIKQSISETIAGVNQNAFESRWLFVLSTTKGEIDYLASGDVEAARPIRLLDKITRELPFTATPRLISNACVSGLAATIYAADHLNAGHFDHALVVGADVVSEFTSRGFASFFALDDDVCKPFDAERKGLNLGEGAASIVLSTRAETFLNQPVRYLSGSTSNDANHISGPSRDGEGLYRSIHKTMQAAKIKAEEVNYISAHGTGTRYNDNMESHAFTRAGLHNIPANSLKGYYGHTLGASSLIELAIGLQSMRSNTVIKSRGYTHPGTVKPLNIAKQHMQTPVNVMLKTASGFGGSNASVLLKKVTDL